MLTNEQIENFIGEVQKKQDEYFKQDEWKHVAPPLISYTRGKKYIRIISDNRYYTLEGEIAIATASRSVFCFLDMDGNILKAAGWKAPAKGIRGNIRNRANDVTLYGAAYMR